MASKQSKKVILILEDEEPLAQVIKEKLERYGFSTVTTRTVAQALSYLEDLKRVDVIWVDHYLLGGEDGLGFVAKIKSDDSRWRHIPIFVVTNTADAGKKQAYLSLRVNKYYTKSDYRLDQIVEDIRKYLEEEK